MVTNLDGNMFVSGKIMDVRGDSFRSDRSFAPLFRGASPDSFVAHVTLDSVLPSGMMRIYFHNANNNNIRTTLDVYAS